MLVEPREASSRTSTFLVAGLGQLDLTTVYKGSGSRSHLDTKAIYTLEQGVLTYCIAPPGQPRPAELATTKGDGFTLVVLKRVTLRRAGERTHNDGIGR
jgi:hypothetical protein